MMIEVINIQKSYGEINVLQSLDLSIAPGETVVIVGKEKAGISTLLRCLANIEEIDRGIIMVNGVNIKQQPKKIATVFQYINLFPHKTVLDSLSEIFMISHKRPKEIAIDHARSLLAKLQLCPIAMHIPKFLSSGEKKLVAIAQALATSPEIFIIDHPLECLPTSLQEKMISILDCLAVEKMTLIIGTNDRLLQQYIQGSIYYLQDGKLTASSTKNK